jgi:hypothetical protein
VNGYTATARIGRAQVRISVVPAAPTASFRDEDAITEALHTSSARDVGFTDRLADLRVLWTQTTFFLFDADAWL